MEVGLIGDSRATLRELIPLLRRHEDRGFLAKAHRGKIALTVLEDKVKEMV